MMTERDDAALRIYASLVSTDLMLRAMDRGHVKQQAWSILSHAYLLADMFMTKKLQEQKNPTPS
jgi:hypothetical protein